MRIENVFRKERRKENVDLECVGCWNDLET